MFLQGVRSVWDMDFDGTHTYGDVFLRKEVEQCVYNYELADVERLYERAPGPDIILPAATGAPGNNSSSNAER